MLSESEFNRLVAGGATHVPLVKTLTPDAMPGARARPVDIYARIADEPYTYLLESADGDKRWGRYSFIGLACRRYVTVRGRVFESWSDGECVAREECDDVTARVEDHIASFQTPKASVDPRFTGGLVGYFGYDAVRGMESRLAHAAAPDALGTPDIFLLESGEVVVVDNYENAAHIVVHATPSDGDDAYAKARARLGDIEAMLRAAPPEPPPASGEVGEFVSSYGEDAFKRDVEAARRYIIDGDIMQMVLSQRQTAPFSGEPLALYRALRDLNPSPYMYYFHFGDHHVVGASPEVLVRVEGEEVVARPIAGTRRRGRNAADDRRLREELLADEKERAEHLMLIDLGRNDLGRVCETGSVKVTERMVIEEYSHVMHMVSHVIGRRRADAGLMEILRACFPAGTVSGAPKIRAMELIDEMEPVKRGIYSGAIGYFAWAGNLDMAIAIRTAVIEGGRLHIQAGAGLVYDSSPQNEWKETMNKARVMLQAAQTATRGAGGS